MSLYKALSEEDVMEARFGLLKEGEYNGFVTLAINSTSMTGNVMADINVRIEDERRVTHDVRDFLVFTPKMLWKIKHFCDSAGLSQVYLDEKFEPHMAEKKHVRVKVSIRKGKEIPFEKLGDKPPGSVYPDQNTIEDYLPRIDSDKPKDNFIDDGLPF